MYLRICYHGGTYVYLFCLLSHPRRTLPTDRPELYIYRSIISYCYQLSNDQIINPPQQICLRLLNRSSCSSLLPPAYGQSDCHVQPLYMVMVFCANMGFPPLSSQELFRHSRLKWGEISPFCTQITKNDDPNTSIFLIGTPKDYLPQQISRAIKPLFGTLGWFQPRWNICSSSFLVRL